MARDLAFLVVAAVPITLGIGALRAPSLPDRAPHFQLADLDGNRVSLADFEGRTVVLNFWATWCGPCRMEAPAFDAFASAHPDVPVIGIALDGPPAKIRRTADELGMNYLILDGDPATFEAYGVSVYPTTVVVNPDGSVRWAHAGILARPQLAWITGYLR